MDANMRASLNALACSEYLYSKDGTYRMFGDKFMVWIMGLPLSFIIAALIFIFICCIGFSLWLSGAFDKKSFEQEKSNEKSESVWENVNKFKKNKKYKISVDVHKSSDWEKDGKIFLCIHNGSFFKKLLDLSVVVAGVYKIEKGVPDIELGRSVILNDGFHLGNRMSFMDLPFIEISKDENKFSVFVKHQEEINGKVIRYEFPQGEYIVNLVVRKLVIFEGQKTSGVIPVRIKYNGLDRIEWAIDFLAMIDYRHGCKMPSSSAIFIQ